jgi:ribosomal protein L24
MKKLLTIASVLIVLAALTGRIVAQAPAITTTISLTDPSTGERIDPEILGVNPTTNRVYVGGFTWSNEAVLAVIDGATNTLITTISLTDPSTGERIDPDVLGVNPKTNRVFVGGFTWSSQAVLAVIDGAKNTLTTTISLTDPSTGEPISPDVLDVNPTTNRVYVGGFTWSGQTVLAVIHGTRITTTISLTDPCTGGRISPDVLGVNPTTNTVYVGGYAEPSSQTVLAVIRGTRITTLVSLTDPCTGERIEPDVLGVNPKTNRVYVGGLTWSGEVLAVLRGTRITTLVSLTDPCTGERIEPDVLGVNPKTNTVYVGGLTWSNQAVLAVIR